MTIQKSATTPTAPSAADAAVTGNKAASEAARKARGVMETVIGPELTPKLSELPTTEARLMALADAIERAELVKRGIGFNMSMWFGYSSDSHSSRRNKIQTEHTCGSIACLAGWTAILEDGEDRTQKELPGRMGTAVVKRATEILGIDGPTAMALFMPQHYILDFAQITPEQAVSVVRHLAKTGKVEWHKFDSEGKPK